MPIFLKQENIRINASFTSISTAIFTGELSTESIILIQLTYALTKIISNLPRLSHTMNIEDIQELVKSSRPPVLNEFAERGSIIFRATVTRQCISHPEYKSLATRPAIHTIANLLLAEDVQDLFRHGFGLTLPGITKPKGGANPCAILIAHCFLSSPNQTIHWINVLVDSVLTEVLQTLSNEMVLRPDHADSGLSLPPHLWNPAAISSPSISSNPPRPSRASQAILTDSSNILKRNHTTQPGLTVTSPRRRRPGTATKAKLLHSPALTRSKLQSGIPRHSNLLKQGGKTAGWRQSALFLADAKNRRASLRSQSQEDQADENEKLKGQ